MCYIDHLYNSAGAFCAFVKALRNEIITELTYKKRYPVSSVRYRPWDGGGGGGGGSSKPLDKGGPGLQKFVFGPSRLSFI